MSNSLSIAVVTAALRDVLLDAMHQVSPISGVPAVTLGRPDAKMRTDFVGANLYLFRVEPNPALRNDNLPVRDGTWTFVAKPRLALDLQYLLTFYGQASTLEPQRLMGAAMSALEAFPELSPDRIRQTIARTDFLAGANLDRQVERVRCTLQPLSIEELSKIWTVFFQVTHELSVAYLASVVLIDAEVPVTKALPAATARTTVVGGPSARIDRLVPSIVEFTQGAAIVLEGSGLVDPSIGVQVNGAVATVTERADDRLTFELPAGVAPGANAVSLVRTVPGIGASPIATPAALTVRPVLHGALVIRSVPIVRVSTTGAPHTANVSTLQFRLTPPLAAAQPATAWLNPSPDSPSSTAWSTTALLRAPLTEDCIEELDAGDVGTRLRAAFRAAGLFLPATAKIAVKHAGVSWTLVDAHSKARYWVSFGDGELLVYSGLSARDPEGWMAFDLTGAPTGKYLVRIQAGADRRSETGLQSGPPDGGFVGPTLSIPPSRT